MRLRDQIAAAKYAFHIIKEELPAAIERYLKDAEERLAAQANGCCCDWYRLPGGPQHRVISDCCLIPGHTTRR